MRLSTGILQILKVGFLWARVAHKNFEKLFLVLSVHGAVIEMLTFIRSAQRTHQQWIGMDDVFEPRWILFWSIHSSSLKILNSFLHKYRFKETFSVSMKTKSWECKYEFLVSSNDVCRTMFIFGGMKIEWGRFENWFNIESQIFV